LLAGVETAVTVSGGRAVAFVLDADSPLANRWQAIRDRLQRVDVSTPDTPSREGFIGRSEKYQTTVGVWLMPDNQHDGKLETFLRTLIAEDDSVIRYAQYVTDWAKKKKGAKFKPNDREKAVIHTWLAWQEEPGKPYGTAIRARFFRHDSPAALGFVAWFRQLFGIGEAGRESGVASE
jgi:hypothetical protein